MPGHKLGVVDVVFCGEAIAWMVRNFEVAPRVINLFEPVLPTKRELIAHLRRANPDLTVVWLVPVVLHPLSWFALALQKLLRPGKPAMNIAKMFARLRYDTSLSAGLASAITADKARRDYHPTEPLREQSHERRSTPAQVLPADGRRTATVA
jgi:hypothetical protein